MFAAMGVLPRPGHLDGGREAYVPNMWVDEEHRGRVLSTRLTRELMGWCVANGMRRVRLQALEQGRRVYESLGFAVTSEMRREAP